MLIAGAGGLAKEVLGILTIEKKITDDLIYFFDDVNLDAPDKIYNIFPVLRSLEEVSEYFNEKGNRYILGLGNPKLRYLVTEKMEKAGGEISKFISNSAYVGSYGTTIGDGCELMPGAIVTNNVILGKGILMNLKASVSHDTSIGDFSELACGVSVAGRCKIGKNVFIGTNSCINPEISIGDNSIIGAGSVVINDIPSNVTAVGNPARIIRTHG